MDRLFNASQGIKGQTAVGLEEAGYREAARYPAPVGVVTREEAVAAAESEYGYRGCMMLSRGSDGGMHYRGDAYSPAAARGWAEEKRRGLVRRILAGECTHTLYRTSSGRLECC